MSWQAVEAVFAALDRALHSRTLLFRADSMLVESTYFSNKYNSLILTAAVPFEREWSIFIIVAITDCGLDADSAHNSIAGPDCKRSSKLFILH